MAYVCDLPAGSPLPRGLAFRRQETPRAATRPDKEVLTKTVSHPRRTLRTRWVGLFALLVLVLAATADAAAPTEPDAQRQLLKEINAARKTHGRAPLRLSKVLAKPARGHSRYVARTGNLTHEGADGRPFYVRLYRAGFPRSKAVGENLGIVGDCETGFAKEIVRMWLRSPDHRTIMLSRRFHVVGLGVVADGNCKNTAYTADFGG